MTPEQRALRDAFLAECWKPVREWHPSADEKAAAWARAQAYPPVVQDAAPKESGRCA